MNEIDWALYLNENIWNILYKIAIFVVILIFVLAQSIVLYIRFKYKILWEKMGSPAHPFGNLQEEPKYSYTDFIENKEYKQLDDNTLSILCEVFRHVFRVSRYYIYISLLLSMIYIVYKKIA